MTKNAQDNKNTPNFGKKNNYFVKSTKFFLLVLSFCQPLCRSTCLSVYLSVCSLTYQCVHVQFWVYACIFLSTCLLCKLERNNWQKTLNFNRQRQTDRKTHCKTGQRRSLVFHLKEENSVLKCLDGSKLKISQNWAKYAHLGPTMLVQGRLQPKVIVKVPTGYHQNIHSKAHMLN